MLTESLCGSDCTTKESFLGVKLRRPGRLIEGMACELTIRFMNEGYSESGDHNALLMDLPQIGAHCSLDACNILDFLPIKCRCNNFYCSAHINPDHHACLANPTTTTTHSPSINTNIICALDECNKASLSKQETCSACHRSFCAKWVLHLT